MSAAQASAIAANLDAVRGRIRRACERSRRREDEVTLIGVTKGQPAEAIIEARGAGLLDFGENYLQEALPKVAALGAGAKDIRVHFIGHLQRNKVKGAVGAFAIVHSVDSLRLLQAIHAAAEPTFEVMIEVNIAAEATKHGVMPGELPGVLDAARSLHHLRVTGLMTVPPAGDYPEASRPWFCDLRELAHEHGLRKLSMGMTGDFEVAIEEGATHVRVGRAIFGERR